MGACGSASPTEDRVVLGWSLAAVWPASGTECARWAASSTSRAPREGVSVEAVVPERLP